MRQLLLIGALMTPAASADVLDAAPGGFTVQHETLIAAERSAVWNTAIDVGSWWSGDHTISGEASRMSIDPRPLGCFCEALSASDGVVHLTVTSVSRNVMLRLTGGLGPLGLMGVSGNFTWEFFDAGDGTRVRFTYAVGGYSANGLDAIAGPVDQVIGDALQRLKVRAERQDDVD